MKALDLLLSRQSCPRLISPCPSEEELQIILEAAVRVPDHAALTPWEFIIVKDQGLQRLGQIFKQAMSKTDASLEKVDKAAELPLRAPMIIICVAKCVEHSKVPILEQQLSAGCSLMAMQQAAFSLGYGGIWRTGALAFDHNVNHSLGLTELDQIVGFLYLGTPAVTMSVKPTRSTTEFIRYL